MNWYLAVLKKYATFTGRARRTEYWVFFATNFLVSLVLGLVGMALGIPNALSVIYGLLVLIPGIAVSVRRLHDTARTGWWLLIGLVPIVGMIVLIVFFVQEGARSPNAYGPDPKLEPAPGSAPAV